MTVRMFVFPHLLIPMPRAVPGIQLLLNKHALNIGMNRFNLFQKHKWARSVCYSVFHDCPYVHLLNDSPKPLFDIVSFPEATLRGNTIPPALCLDTSTLCITGLSWSAWESSVYSGPGSDVRSRRQGPVLGTQAWYLPSKLSGSVPQDPGHRIPIRSQQTNDWENRSAALNKSSVPLIPTKIPKFTHQGNMSDIQGWKLQYLLVAFEMEDKARSFIRTGHFQRAVTFDLIDPYRKSEN